MRILTNDELLSIKHLIPTAEKRIEFWIEHQERVAIQMFDGGLDEETAHKQALEDVAKNFELRRQNK